MRAPSEIRLGLGNFLAERLDLLRRIPFASAGDDDATVLIRPGHEGAAAYSASRDGQLQPAIASTPAAHLFNLAMQPGWQRWKPTYRLGIVTAIDKDARTCNITLVPASSPYGQDVNAVASLTAVPIEYMDCDADAFDLPEEDEDDLVVLVEFEGQSWDNPKVIGFKESPSACPEEWPPCDCTSFSWGADNPETVPSGGETWLSIDSTGNCGPVVWETSSSGASFPDPALPVLLTSGACGPITVTATSCAGQVATGTLRAPGQWLMFDIVCVQNDNEYVHKNATNNCIHGSVKTSIYWYSGSVFWECGHYPSSKETHCCDYWSVWDEDACEYGADDPTAKGLCCEGRVVEMHVYQQEWGCP